MRMLWRFFPAAVLGAMLSGVVLSIPARAEPALAVGEFSKGQQGKGIPSGWQPLTFKKISAHTRYELVEDRGTVVVRALSQAAASGLIRHIRIDPVQYPVIRWRWKITSMLKKADVSRKQGDDYAARIYITFEYDPGRAGIFDRIKYEGARLLYGQYPPSAAISYIWEGRAPEGAVIPNAYTDKLMMIVVESGEEKLNAWVDEQRNVYEDFKTAFGKEPPVITGVAIMTDTDNTGETAVSFYGDIGFYKTLSSDD
ncbi:MAG: DUF3047 domain-containing protein [Desulfobacterales bacterium]|nr:DUF3047 domain-containing protein [Desulfobacterales bacterium]MDD4073292.1 DUF3047 domain-containing protein [Desulfobacterales bacterium]MDD4393860.1 DUF3047 domain-containing protein [Desulfobacterales bacterium]